MANSMILVTQDHYLFQGVKNFFPDIIQLDSSGKAILDNEVDELSLLVDSRSPLCHYDYLVMEAAQSRKRICCIVLDMRHREEHLLSLKSFLNMSLSPADMATLFGLFLEMKSNRLTKEWFDNLRLSMTEQLMLRFLGAGMTMEEVAVNLNTSLKSLYRKRTALYERLGLDNFNEACLFIFKNKLLDQSGRSP